MLKSIYKKCSLKRILNYNEIVEQKGEMANVIVDGKVTMNNKELLNYLLS